MSASRSAIATINVPLPGERKSGEIGASGSDGVRAAAGAQERVSNPVGDITNEMCAAGMAAWNDTFGSPYTRYAAIFKAMLAAAPAAPIVGADNRDKSVPPIAPADSVPPGNIPQADARIYQSFWEKYALGSKCLPSCFQCGREEPDRDKWAITHAELPDIYICAGCLAAPQSLRTEAVTHQVAVTAEMEAAGSRAWNDSGSLANAFKAMLAAAPGRGGT